MAGPTIKKPHVDLIPEHLAKVEGNTLSTSSGETVEADVIILATGFQTTNVLGSYDIVGREGQLLRDHWGEDNASAYLGTLVPGFPNFFILLGPNVGSGHGGSMIRNIENQMHFAGQVVQCAEAREASTVEVKETAYTDYSRRIDDAHDRLVWTHPGTENWPQFTGSRRGDHPVAQRCRRMTRSMSGCSSTIGESSGAARNMEAALAL